MNPFLRRNWFTVKNQLATMVRTVSIEESGSLMVGASKILTVSYGTFSCTLEGFDEPFSTMKAIAEYFRDLAADDRYFGAEPPTPDAEMLHRIAEREINRRVEAKVGTHGITLRAQEPLAPLATESVPEPALEPVASATPAPMPQAEAEPAAVESPVPAAIVAETISIEDSVAAKLARIRAAVAGARAAALHPAYEDETTASDFAAAISESDFAFDIDLGGPMQSDAEAEIATPAPKPAPQSRDADAQASAPRRAMRRAARTAAALAALTAAAEPLVAIANEVEPEPAPADAAQAEDAALEPAAESEFDSAPEVAEAAAQEPAPADEAQAVAEVAAPEPMAEPEAAPAPEMAETAAEEAEPAEAETATSEDSPLAPEPFATLAEAPEDEWFDAASIAVEPIAEQPTTIADERDDETGISELLSIVADGDSADATPEPLLPATETGEIAVDSADEADDDAGLWFGAEPDETELEPEPVPAPQAPRVRVIKVRRAEPAPVEPEDAGAFSAADAAAQSDEDTLAAVAAALDEIAAPPPEPVLLSPEAEAELARELAELEAELEPADAAALPTETAAVAEPHADLGDDEADAVLSEAIAAEPETPLGDAPPRPVMVRAPRDATTEPAEANLSRLLDETNTKLEGPENRRRFSAIAHLKAAVAATVADRKLRSVDEAAAADAVEERDLERYREDLTKAVRPRRPAPGTETATQRPAVPEPRPAPLVLVSEQRIDRPRNAPAEQHVIRPRRISVAQVAAAARQQDDDEDEFDDGAAFVLGSEQLCRVCRTAWCRRIARIARSRRRLYCPCRRPAPFFAATNHPQGRGAGRKRGLRPRSGPAQLRLAAAARQDRQGQTWSVRNYRGFALFRAGGGRALTRGHPARTGAWPG